MQGAARMVLQTGIHPAALKDSVTSMCSIPFCYHTPLMTSFLFSRPCSHSSPISFAVSLPLSLTRACPLASSWGLHHCWPSSSRGRPSTFNCSKVYSGDHTARSRVGTGGASGEEGLDGRRVVVESMRRSILDGSEVREMRAESRRGEASDHRGFSLEPRRVRQRGPRKRCGRWSESGRSSARIASRMRLP